MGAFHVSSPFHSLAEMMVTWQ